MFESRLKSRLALRFIQLLDMVAIAAIVVYARESTSPLTSSGLLPLSQIHLPADIAVYLVVIALIWRYIFILAGNYNFRYFEGWKILTRIFVSCTLGVGISMLATLLMGVQINWNSFPVLIWSIAIPFFLSFRALIFMILYFVRAAGRNLRNLVIVGLNSRSLAMWRRLKGAGLGLDIQGYFDDRQWTMQFRHSGSEPTYLGELKDFGDYISRNPVDQVLLALPVRSRYDEIHKIINQCAAQGVQVWQLSELFDLPTHTVFRFGRISDKNFLNYLTSPHTELQYELKRLMDVILSLCALIALAPVFLIVSILILLDDGWPIFYCQERIGLNKRRFKVFKFRSMIKDAEKMQTALEAENEYDGAAFKMVFDPRTTRIGAFLRRTSLDEIPQFMNVLLGTMSLVGPRPLPVRDFERFYNDSHRMRFSVKPGITCIWQVSGRSRLNFEEWMKLDLEYVHNWSMLMDLKILLLTAVVVLTEKGAY